MKRECRQFWEGVVQLAHGIADPAAETHCAHCPDCSQRLVELSEMRRVLQMELFEPPDSVLLRAKSIFGVPERLPLRLLSNSLAGARSVTEAFQCLYEIGAVRVRFMVQAEGSTWRVMGRIEGTDLQLEIDEMAVEPDAEGRFELIVDSPTPQVWIAGNGKISSFKLGEGSDDA